MSHTPAVNQIARILVTLDDRYLPMIANAYILPALELMLFAGGTMADESMMASATARVESFFAFLKPVLSWAATVIAIVLLGPPAWRLVFEPSGITLEKPVMAQEKIDGRGAEFFNEAILHQLRRIAAQARGDVDLLALGVGRQPQDQLADAMEVVLLDAIRAAIIGLEQQVSKPDQQVVAKTGLHETLDAVIAAVASMDGRDRRISLLIDCQRNCENKDEGERRLIRVSGVVGLGRNRFRSFEAKVETGDEAAAAMARRIAALTMPTTLAGLYLLEADYATLHALAARVLADPYVSAAEKQLLLLMQGFAGHLDLAPLARQVFADWRDGKASAEALKGRAEDLLAKLQASADRVPVQMNQGPHALLIGLLNFHQRRMHLVLGDRITARRIGEKSFLYLSHALSRQYAGTGSIKRAIALIRMESGAFGEAAALFRRIRMDDLPPGGRYVVRRDYARASYCDRRDLKAVEAELRKDDAKDPLWKADDKEIMKIMSDLPGFAMACAHLKTLP